MDKTEIAIKNVEHAMKYQPMPAARKIALGIYADVTDRRGIKSEIAQCDEIVIQEMISAWEEIARVVIDGEV
jgi:hypothetical protein